MAGCHKRLNIITGLYLFFTVSLPDFDFAIGKAGTWQSKGDGRESQAVKRRSGVRSPMSWHDLSLFVAIWHPLFARAGKGKPVSRTQ